MLISFAVTAKLICVFVFAYAKSRFSHDKAHITQQLICMFLSFSVPDDFKVNPGAVESIAVHAKNPDKVS